MNLARGWPTLHNNTKVVGAGGAIALTDSHDILNEAPYAKTKLSACNFTFISSPFQKVG